MPNVKIGEDTLTNVSVVKLTDADDTSKFVEFCSSGRATFEITAPAGSTIDILQNSIIIKSYTLGASETFCSLKVDVSSTLYTVRATLGSKTTEKDVLATAANIYEIELWFGRLPYGYNEVEYIESSGTQYIETSYMYTYNDEITCTFLINSIVNDTSIFGSTSYSDTNTDRYILQMFDPWSRGIMYFQLQPQILETEEVAINTIYNTKSSINTNLSVLTINNRQYTGQGVTYSNPQTLILFARKWGKNPANFSHIKMYSFIVKRNNIVIRDFVPAIRVSDGVIGMCDLCKNICPATGTFFFVNSGTGSFIAGPEVE